MERHDYYVYILFRENTEPFYVGYGQKKRWIAHEYEATHTTNKTRKCSIIRRLLETLGEVPKIKVSDDLTLDDAKRLEILLIKIIGRHPNGPLVNLTAGGDGGDFSEETIEKMRRNNWFNKPEARIKHAETMKSPKVRAALRKGSANRTPAMEAARKAAAKEATSSQAVKDKISLTMRGRTFSPEHRANLCNKPQTSEKRAKISAARKGKPPSQEHREKLSAAHRGVKLSSEHAANIGKSLAGKKRSPEVIANVMAGRKRAKEQRCSVDVFS